MRRQIKVNTGTEGVIEELVSVVNRVMRPVSTPGYLMQDEFPHLLGKDNAKNVYYVEEDGKPVAVIAVKIWGAYLKDHRISVASLGSVSTLPEYRGNGYATQILERILTDLRKRNVPVLLVSGTRDLYNRAGCIQTGMVYYYRIGKEELARIAQPEEYSVRRVTKRSDAAEWTLQLYLKEPYRFDRDINLMRTLLDAIWFRREEWQMELFEISQDGQKVAYFIGYKKGPDSRTLRVMEMAGSRQAIAQSLHRIIEYMDADEVNLRVHPTDNDLIRLLESFHLPRDEAPAQGTVMVTSPQTLLTELGDFIGKQGWKCTARRIMDSEELVCDSSVTHIEAHTPQEITDCFFGTGEKSLKIPLMFTDDLNYI